MNTNNKCIYVVALIGSVAILSSHEVIHAAEKSVALSVPKVEQKKSEVWRAMTPLQGKFYALIYPDLLSVEKSKRKRIFERKVEFAPCCLSALDSSLRQPFKSETIISRDGMFKLAVVWTSANTSVIERYARVKQLIADKQ